MTLGPCEVYQQRSRGFHYLFDLAVACLRGCWKRVVVGSVRTLGLYDRVSRASVWLFARWCEQLQKHTRHRFP